MKLWIKVIRKQKILRDTVFSTDRPVPDQEDRWASLLSEALKPMDIACPIVMNRHVRDFAAFQRADFLPTDFMESVPFDRLDAEILPEKKAPIPR